MYLQRQLMPPLSSFVQVLWYAKGSPGPHRRERVLPNGTLQLVINLAHDHFLDCPRDAPMDPHGLMPPSLIVGVHSRYHVLDTADLVEVMGVQFRPAGFVPFFAIPADEFKDAHVSLEAVWGCRARQLRDRLRETPPPESKLRILEAALLARAGASLPVITLLPLQSSSFSPQATLRA